MIVLAKVHKLDDIISGSTADGKDWEKQTVIVEIAGNEKKLAVEFFGAEKVAITKELKVGQVVSVTYQIESTEYNGKWFTKLVGISITPYQVRE